MKVFANRTDEAYGRIPLGELFEGKPHEQFLRGGTGNGPNLVLRQSFTRQVWFKQAKQHLGLGALHRIRWEGVVKHLHVSACSFGLLTHLAYERSEKGKSNLIHAAGSVLPARSELRDLFFQDAIDYFIEKELNQKPSADIVDLKKFLFQQDETLQMAA